MMGRASQVEGMAGAKVRGSLVCSRTRQESHGAEEWWVQCKPMHQAYLPSSPWPALETLFSRNL